MISIGGLNPLGKIFLYVLVVLVCGVLISPPAYWACEWMISKGWLTMLEGFPFHRYFSRTVQVSALVLLVPLVLWLNVRSMSRLGIEKNPLRWKDLGMGFVLAFLPMALLAGGYLLVEVYGFRAEPRWSMLGRAALSAAAVSVLEEFFFRGVILGLAIASFGRIRGVALSAVVFAVVHFLKPAKIADSEPVTWLSGLRQLGLVFQDLPSAPLLAFGVLTLLVSGVLLAVVTVRTRSLWLAIGVHAGWVYGQQSFQALARFRVKPEEALLPWVGPNVVSGAVPTGLVPIVALVVTGGCLWWWLRMRERQH